MNRWLWILPISSVLLSVAVLLSWGWAWQTAVLIMFVLVCPAVVIWQVLHLRAKHAHAGVARKKIRQASDAGD